MTDYERCVRGLRGRRAADKRVGDVLMVDEGEVLSEEIKAVLGGEYDVLEVPVEGWTKEEMDNLRLDGAFPYNRKGRVIFLSSAVPYLLATLCRKAWGNLYEGCDPHIYDVWMLYPEDSGYELIQIVD